MGDLSIKVTIANRVYPLTIKREEEDRVRKAVAMVNENMKQLEENYAVRDRQDLLAMTALDYATRLGDQVQQGDHTVADTDQLYAVDAKLDTYLNSI